MKTNIVITVGNNITSAIVLKLIELLNTSKVDVHHASLHDAAGITPIVGTLEAGAPITSLVTMGSPAGKETATLDSIDLKVTALLDEVRALRTPRPGPEEKDLEAQKTRKAKNTRGAVSGSPEGVKADHVVIIGEQPEKGKTNAEATAPEGEDADKQAAEGTEAEKQPTEDTGPKEKPSPESEGTADA